MANLVPFPLQQRGSERRAVSCVKTVRGPSPETDQGALQLEIYAEEVANEVRSPKSARRYNTQEIVRTFVQVRTTLNVREL
jgi:hypothetical protein